MPTTRPYVTHLECGLTGESDYKAGEIHGLSRAGRPLLVRYDLEAMKNTLDRDYLAGRRGGLCEGFFRWRDLLPVAEDKDCVSLGEVDTPLINSAPSATLAGGTGRCWIKDEGRLPTGSFKARGLALAVSMGKQLGIDHFAIPTNGNAGAALAAYCARAGIKATVLCPDETPDINVQETVAFGADVFRVNGLIHHCAKIIQGGKEEKGWFDVSTLKEPYRIEGKKTMGIELAYQLGWRLPDAIFYPTGGGTGLIGMWKAFDELEKLGWIGSERPKMFAVQSSGCAPIVRAYDKGERHAEEWLDAASVASGIRVPVAVGDFLILDAVRESGGAALAVNEDEIMDARDKIAAADGTLLCPEGAATWLAYRDAISGGLIEKDAEVMLFNCGTGLKYPLPETAGRLDRHATIDYGRFK